MTMTIKIISISIFTLFVVYKIKAKFSKKSAYNKVDTTRKMWNLNYSEDK